MLSFPLIIAFYLQITNWLPSSSHFCRISAGNIFRWLQYRWSNLLRDSHTQSRKYYFKVILFPQQLELCDWGIPLNSIDRILSFFISSNLKFYQGSQISIRCRSDLLIFHWCLILFLRVKCFFVLWSLSWDQNYQSSWFPTKIIFTSFLNDLIYQHMIPLCAWLSLFSCIRLSIQYSTFSACLYDVFK